MAIIRLKKSSASKSAAQSHQLFEALFLKTSGETPGVFARNRLDEFQLWSLSAGFSFEQLAKFYALSGICLRLLFVNSALSRSTFFYFKLESFDTGEVNK